MRWRLDYFQIAHDPEREMPRNISTESLSSPKPIANVALGEDVCRMARIVFKLLP
jgi:hypothetical protein